MYKSATQRKLNGNCEADYETSFIGAGHCNGIGSFAAGALGAYRSFIGSGTFNCIDTNATTASFYNSIAGGQHNKICAAVNHSFIGGGGDTSAALGNTISGSYSSIVGGSYNRVPGAFSSIVGGYNNIVNGNYSSIFGGINNTIPAGFNNAGVFGQGVTAVASNTLHVNCLNACNTPLAFGGAPAGSVMYKAFSTLLPTDKVLVIP